MVSSHWAWPTRGWPSVFLMSLHDLPLRTLLLSCSNPPSYTPNSPSSTSESFPSVGRTVHMLDAALIIDFQASCEMLLLTIVCCRKGEVVFRSDNMSTVSVLREVLSKETALKKTSVRITHGETATSNIYASYCTTKLSWPP